MTIPVWLAAVIAGALIAQLVAGIAWAINARQELALLRQIVTRVEDKLDRHDLAVLAIRVEKLEHQSAEHQAAHGRNRERIENLRDEMHTLLSRRPTPNGG